MDGTITLPKGRYYIGDPCYFIGHPHENWIKILDECDYFNKPYKVGRKIAVAFGTVYGDGEYYDENNNNFYVDSGMIGAVPVNMADTTPTPRGFVVATFTEPFECFKEGGKIHIGSYVIDTDPQDEEDDVCEHCGR